MAQKVRTRHENYKTRTRYGVIDRSHVEKIQGFVVNFIHQVRPLRVRRNAKLVSSYIQVCGRYQEQHFRVICLYRKQKEFSERAGINISSRNIQKFSPFTRTVTLSFLFSEYEKGALPQGCISALKSGSCSETLPGFFLLTMERTQDSCS